MSKAMSADQFVSALRGEGLDVVEHAGWRSNNRNHKGAWGDVKGVVIHHTAGRNSLALCFKGMSSLPGPLCHTHLAKDGTATMVGNGRANHAGTFAVNAVNAMISEAATHPRPDSSEPIDGNAITYGIEIENLGDGRDFYPQAQYDAAVRWAAAICRFHGWSADSVIGHKEGTRRKIDPKGPIGSASGRMWDMDDFRADVQALLSGKPKPAQSQPEAPAKSQVARYKVTIGGKEYGYGAYGDHVTAVGAALVKRGFGKHYSEGPGPRWTDADTLNYADFQRSLGYSGADADGVPGASSLSKLLPATPAYEPFPGAAYFKKSPNSSLITRMGKRLVAEGCSAYRSGPGPQWTEADRASYAKWQRKLGYRGADADGYPGASSWAKLRVPRG